MGNMPEALTSRRKTRVVRVGNLALGSDYPVVVQSMTNTDTAARGGGHSFQLPAGPGGAQGRGGQAEDQPGQYRLGAQGAGRGRGSRPPGSAHPHRRQLGAAGGPAPGKKRRV